VLECSDILLLILVGIISGFGRLLCRLESEYPLKCLIYFQFWWMNILDSGRLLCRLESNYLLKCHNRVPTCLCDHGTTFCYQCLVLLLTGYIALTVICNHNRVLCQVTAAWSATGRSAHMETQLVKTYVWTIHTNHCLDTLCWSNSTAGKAYKIAKMRYFATAKLELTDTAAI